VAKSNYNKKNYNRNKQKSNNGILIGIGAVLVVCIAILIIIPLLEDKHPIYGVPESKLNAATRALLDDPNYANTISAETLDEKVNNKEDFFVYMYAATCIYCKETTPVIMPLADELNIHVEQFNLLEYKDYQGKYDIQYTPTLVYFEDGIEKERIVGGVALNGAEGNSIEDYKAFFEKYKSN